MSIDNKTSLLVPSQLPEFIRDEQDYQNFVEFIKAYYEWMESANVANSSVATANSTNQGVVYATKNLRNYTNIDDTLDDFIQYYLNDFLPNFPQDALIDKKKAIKVARELYSSKGTPGSYKFLFRMLYNSDFDVFYTKDAVLKASDGDWYISKSLKLATDDPNFLEIKNYRLFGETSKSYATIETAIGVGSKTEIFISSIERLFQSGEFVRVIDENYQDVLFNGEPLRAKVVGQISSIKINPANRGLLYEKDDPVIVYGGLTSNTGLGASARVNEITTGSIQRINVVKGGWGYRMPPNSAIKITNAIGAAANIGSVDPNILYIGNVTNIISNTIALSEYTTIGNAIYSFLGSHANANTSIANAFTLQSFETYPISSVYVENGGGGIKKIPTVTPISSYYTNLYQPNTGNPALANTFYRPDIKTLGILAPIQVANSGHGYSNTDTIVISGGSGYGAYAAIANVNNQGQIIQVSYVEGALPYPLGGIGYKRDALPTVTVVSANVQAANAELYVPGILGDGAEFSIIVDKAGSISTIEILDPGEDYLTAPNVSLRVQDIVVSNVNTLYLAERESTIYQGQTINLSTYRATVNSVTILQPALDSANDLYNLRVFDYKGVLNPKQQFKVINNANANYKMANTAFTADYFYVGSPEYSSSGVKTYGDGSAKARAFFLSGLVIGEGQYISSRGQPSSFDVLQSDTYNNYTYQITVEKEIAKYRKALLNMVHPTGMKVVGRYAMKSNNKVDLHGFEALNQGHNLYYYTNSAAANVVMETTFTDKSTNLLQFYNLGSGVDISTFIFSNSTIALKSTNGPEIHGEVVSINVATNTVTIASNTWLTFSNVAYATGNTGENFININSFTGTYDVINNGNYSNTAFPLHDIVFAGDQVLVANNTAKVVNNVDYEHGIIYLTANLTSNSTNSLMAVKRTFSAGGTVPTANQVIIYGPVGVQYYPELATEAGETLTTEDDKIILIG